MKIQAILCIISFHMLVISHAEKGIVHGSPLHGAQQEIGITAKVYTNETEPIREPRFSNPFIPPCNRPQEDRNIFRACNASGTTNFPAMDAYCKCTQCDGDLKLKCASDGAWYASVPNVCTASDNCHKKCNISDLGTAESPVHCSFIKIGDSIRIHECRCKRNCLKPEVKCDENEGWVIDKTPCQSFEFDRMKEAGNLTVSYRNGVYTYGCETGFLEGNLTNRCNDGVLSGEAPKCVPVAPVKLGTIEVMNESTASESSMSGLFVALIVLLVLVVVFLLTYIIYWKYREESKAWLMRKMRRRPLPRPPLQRPGTEDHYEYIDINACAIGVGAEYSTPYMPVVRSGDSSGSNVTRLEVGATLRNNSSSSCDKTPDVPQNDCVSVANELYGDDWRENSNDLSKNQELKTADFVPNALNTAPKKPERKNILRKDASTSIFLPEESEENENVSRKDAATSIFLPKTSSENGHSFLKSPGSENVSNVATFHPKTSSENAPFLHSPASGHENMNDAATSSYADPEENYDVLNHNTESEVPNRIVIEPRKNPSVPFAVPPELIKFSDSFVAPVNEEVNSYESIEDNNAVMNEPRTNPAKKLNSDESDSLENLETNSIEQKIPTVEVIDQETSTSTSGENLNSNVTLPTDESARVSNDLFEATVHFPNMSLLNRTMFDPDDDMKGT